MEDLYTFPTLIPPPHGLVPDVAALEAQVATLRAQLDAALLRESDAAHAEHVRAVELRVGRARSLWYHIRKAEVGAVRRVADAEFAALDRERRAALEERCGTIKAWRAALRETHIRPPTLDRAHQKEEMASTTTTTKPRRSSKKAEKIEETQAPAPVQEEAPAPVQEEAPAPVQEAESSSSSDTPTKDVAAYATSLRRIQKTSKALAEMLKTLNYAEGRKLALDIAREAHKALSNQEARPTGYQLFIKMNSGQYRKDIEGSADASGQSKSMHTQMVFRKIAETWRSLSDEEKARYNSMVTASA